MSRRLLRRLSSYYWVYIAKAGTYMEPPPLSCCPYGIIRACAAVYAQVRVDRVLIALGNSLRRTFIDASSASDAVITDYVCHSVVFCLVCYVPQKYILLSTSPNGLAVFTITGLFHRFISDDRIPIQIHVVGCDFNAPGSSTCGSGASLCPGTKDPEQAIPGRQGVALWLSCGD